MRIKEPWINFLMGLDLTWSVKDRIKHGNCGEDLETIVHFRLPESSGATNGGITASPERDSHYAINHPEVLHNLELPENETGYAVEYTEMDRILSREEVIERLREFYEKDFPDKVSMGDKKNYIDARIKSHFDQNSFDSIGTTFVAGIVIKDGEAEVLEKKFVRWVSKGEYDSKVEEAKHRIEDEDEEVWMSREMG